MLQIISHLYIVGWIASLIFATIIITMILRKRHKIRGLYEYDRDMDTIEPEVTYKTDEDGVYIYEKNTNSIAIYSPLKKDMLMVRIFCYGPVLDFSRDEKRSSGGWGGAGAAYVPYNYYYNPYGNSVYCYPNQQYDPHIYNTILQNMVQDSPKEEETVHVTHLIPTIKISIVSEDLWKNLKDNYSTLNFDRLSSNQYFYVVNPNLHSLDHVEVIGHDETIFGMTIDGFFRYIVDNIDDPLISPRQRDIIHSMIEAKRDCNYRVCFNLYLRNGG